MTDLAPRIAQLRHEYMLRGLSRSDLQVDPMEQFKAWFSEALGAELMDANAMHLATASPEGVPSGRMVLLKGFDERGFIFYTNYRSAKAQELEANPNASLVVYWAELERQISIGGGVTRVSREESAEYFHTRPLGSQLGAWASPQSEVIESRSWLEARLAEVTEKFKDGQVPLPDFWGGYCLAPRVIEFWQGRPNRLHDRFRYSRGDDGWKIERLAP